MHNELSMKVALLQRLPLFAHLDIAAVTVLAANMEQEIYRKGDLIFNEDEKAERMFVVAAGRVKIFKTNKAGREHILHVIPPQSIVAEVPMFAGDKYPASCMALDDVVLLALPRTKFIQLICHDPQIALNLLALQAQRMREFTSEIERLTLRNSEQKLAAYLLEHAVADKQSGKLVVEIGRLGNLHLQELANYLGVTREHLSRLMSKLVRNKIIGKEQGKGKAEQRIILSNIAALKNL
jgi:CRP/FNR family transcriptional regulator, dissimilatory nitrate respiration regulator